MCLQNQPLQNQPNLLRQLSKTETSLDQYRKDLGEAETKNDIIKLGYEQMIKKYTAYANASECLTVKLIASNIVQDLKNILTVANTSTEEIINT
jgi:uncharacterized membrane-anchored protein YhcB (DUF1043 family)